MKRKIIKPKPRQSFLDFCKILRGKKVVRSTYDTGTQIKVEIPKYILYWSCMSPKQIKEKFIVIDR